MRFKTEQRAFAALAGFIHQQQMCPDRRIGDCEVDTDRLVSGRGEGPVERRANVVDLSNPARQVLIRQRRFGASRPRCEEIAKIQCMVLRGDVGLGVLGKLLDRVGTDRFQQSPAGVAARFVQRHP